MFAVDGLLVEGVHRRGLKTVFSAMLITFSFRTATCPPHL